MIRQITDEGEIALEMLTGNHYGKRFRALLQAYGTCYDFCRFYEIFKEKISAYFVVLNSSMTVVTLDTDRFDLCEFSIFVEMNGVTSIEMPLSLAEKISLNNYIKTERVLFEFKSGDFSPEMDVNEKPELDEVFKIAKTGFPLKDCYELWLTDTSHQIRHGISRLFLYHNTTAAMYYNIDDVAFFGQIATAPADRGKGYARELLYWLEDKMSKDGVSAHLFAKPDRVSFYKIIGFKEVGRDIVFERVLKLNEIMKSIWVLRLQKTSENLKENNMDVFYADKKEDVIPIVKNLIEEGSIVANGGSMTLGECGVFDLLRSGKYNFLDREGLTREEVTNVYIKSFSADAYLCSCNAITENGELYNVDGTSNRIAAISYGPKAVIMVVGYNKIVRNIDEAITRVKKIAAPANAKRLSSNTYCVHKSECLECSTESEMTSGCKGDSRICCNYLISARQRIKGRIKIIIVGEELGY